MFQQQAGEKKMSEMIGGKCPFESILGCSIGIEACAGVVDEHIHMFKLLSNGRCQLPHIVLHRKVRLDKLRAERRATSF